jgi:hypothetical protein
MLLRWPFGADSPGNVPGGTVGGARFGVLCSGDGCMPSRRLQGSAAESAAAQQTGDIFNNLASFNFLTNAYTKRRINVYTSTFRSRVRTSSSCAEVCLAVLNRAGADYRPAREAVPGWRLVFLPGVLNWPPGDFRCDFNGQGEQITAEQVH